MIPYVAVPFFGAITGNFDATGAGIGSWEKIYLCNGQNFTPDLRGRTLVGATTMGNTAFNPTVDPGIAGNPAYALNTLAGANQGFITSVGQIPSHTHAATVTINEIPHTHTYEGKVVNTRSQEGSNGHYAVDFGPFTTSPSSTGLKGNGNDPINPNVIVTIGETGGSSVAGHNNIQPSIGVNYIIYIP
jgi:microcystin-dependent protein